MKRDLNRLEKMASKPAKLSRSTPILIKNRCSSCGEPPSGIDFYGEGYVYKDVYKMRVYSVGNRDGHYFYYYNGKRYYRRDLYIESVDYKGYNPRIHTHTRHNAPHSNSTIIYVYCKCSNWILQKETTFDRPEISNRKILVTSKQNR